jgi:hypothetical protein
VRLGVDLTFERGGLAAIRPPQPDIHPQRRGEWQLTLAMRD